LLFPLPWSKGFGGLGSIYLLSLSGRHAAPGRVRFIAAGRSNYNKQEGSWQD